MIVIIAILVALLFYLILRKENRKLKINKNLIDVAKSGRLAGLSEEDMKKIKISKRGDLIFPDDETTITIKGKITIKNKD